MAINLKTFKPGSAGELAEALKISVSEVAADWWNATKDSTSGHLKTLAEAAVETQAGLATGQLTQKQAARSLRGQRRLLQQIALHNELMTLVLAQRIADTALEVVGYAIFNTTGINLFPDVVD